MSGLFKSTVIKGNRITDFTQTTATVGVVIPFGYGRFPVDGNVIFAPLPPKENRTVKRQGKGGVKQESFTYTLSYAIAFCRGPIYGYWWIKRNGKVVWTNDPNAPIEDAAYAAKWAQKATFYYGTSSQMPDSTIESYKGSGQVSAFRYLAYIVVEDDDVTEGGGAVPSYEAVPIASPPEIYLTSHPYAQIFYSEAKTGLAPTGGLLKQLLFESDMQSDEAVTGLAPTGGALFEVPPPEFHDETTAGLAPTGGELKTPPPQNFKDQSTAGLAPTGGTLKVPPVGQMQKDESTAGLAPTGGTLFVPDKSWNPSDKSAATILTNVNKTATANAASNTIKYARSIKSKNSGKWRVQFLLETFGASCSMGFATSAALGSWLGNNAAGWALWGNYSGSQVRAYTNNAYSTFTGVFTTGDVIDLLIDIDAGKAWWRINGVVVSGDPVAGTGAMLTFTAGTTLFVAADTYNGSSITLRALSADMTGSAVSGYTNGWDD